MKKSDITKIYNMCQPQRQSFKTNYPTAGSLANAINKVIMGDTVKAEPIVEPKVKEQSPEVY